MRKMLMAAAAIAAPMMATEAGAVVTIANTGSPGWAVAGGGVAEGTAPTVAQPLPSGWAANSAASQWISINTSGQDTPGGNYTYSTFFQAAVGDIVNFTYWVDDRVLAMSVDGTSLPIGPGTFGSGTAGSFTVTQLLANHTLAFTTQNNNFATGTPANPSGFRFEAAAAVPEPATWGMMILGFGAVGMAMRRRRTSTKVVFA